MNYEDMSLDQLEKFNQDAMNKRDKIKEEQRKIVAVMDAKSIMEEAKKKAATMSDPAKVALLQVLRPEGIESEETVNEG